MVTVKVKVEVVLFILLVIMAIVFFNYRERSLCDPNTITVEELDKIQKEYLTYTEKDSKDLNTRLLKAVYGSACKK